MTKPKNVRISDPTPISKEIKLILELIKSRLETSNKYGPDMASSRELCIQDAIDTLQMTIDRINSEEL